MTYRPMHRLIAENGEKIAGYCSNCNGPNLWRIDDKGAKVCSYCDVEIDHRWEGHKEFYE